MRILLMLLKRRHRKIQILLQIERGKKMFSRFAHLLVRYLVLRLKGAPYVINIEVTYRCNAKCDHCMCWRIETGEELPDFADVIRKFRPIIVWFTGGEPLLREDIIPLIRRIKENDSHLYLGIATNGWFLSPELGKQLVEAGLDQVNLSLDFIGTQHDKFRKINGLYNHIIKIAPVLKNLGLCVVLSCCIMRQNLGSLLSIARLAEALGVEVGYTCYGSLKTGDENLSLTKKQLRQVHQIVETLCDWKKKRGFIKSSFTYLRKIPEFWEKGTLGNCEATKTWLHMAPDGHLKICSDKHIYSHYKDYSGSLNIDCGDCWYTCRGEMETPISERLFWEVRNLKRKSFVSPSALNP